jgi:putative transposase
MMERVYKGRPPRLAQVFSRDGWPLYYVTICTLARRAVLASSALHDAFREYGERGLTMGVGVGRYVIMPDHIHAFVRIAPPQTLKGWSAGLKRCLSKALTDSGVTLSPDHGQHVKSVWQPGFFDHLLRGNESYAEKWAYVRENPVRAGLVEHADDWPYQGEIVVIDRV